MMCSRLLSVSSSLLVALSGCMLLPERPAWEQPSPAPVEGPIVAPEDFRRARLPNGLTLMVLEDHRLPRLSIGLQLRRGAGSVNPQLAGVAVLASEVMQRGAGDRDALQLAHVVEDAGASLSVSAHWDTTSVSISGLSEDRDLFLEILEDVALRPRFDAGEFDKALAEQKAALVAAQDNPATLVGWYAARALYDDHRYGLPRSGTDETLARIDVDAVREYWTSRFVPRNTIFWAVGDLSSADMIEEVTRRFGFLPDLPIPPGTPPPPLRTPEARRIVVVDKPELGQARIIVAHEGISRTEPTRIAIDLMNNVLGGSGFSSRLMQTVRADAGLTYGVGSGFSLRRQPGPFSVSTFTRVSEVRRVVDLLLSEIAAIRSDRPVDEAELRSFVSYNVGRFGLSLETSRAVLSSLVNLEAYGLPGDSLDTYRARVRQVRLAEVAEAAATRLHPERAAIVVLGPAADLVPQLEDLGSVEVWQP
ncbi:MAG: pitrilysin family protein [Myxococcota bacterium]